MERFDALLPAAGLPPHAARDGNSPIPMKHTTWTACWYLPIPPTAKTHRRGLLLCGFTGGYRQCNYGEDIDWLFLPDSGIDEDYPPHISRNRR